MKIEFFFVQASLNVTLTKNTNKMDIRKKYFQIKHSQIFYFRKGLKIYRTPATLHCTNIRKSDKLL